MLTIKRNLAALATAVASALVLTGCGGGGSSSGTGSSASTFSITAMDGYLKNADVWVDANNDLNDGCELDLGLETGDGGLVNIPIEYQDSTICIKTIVGKTIDEDQGPVERPLELKAPAGETVVSPLTNLVVEQLEEDDSLTVDEAKNKVIEELVGLTGVTAEDVFGDFVAAKKSGDDKGKAINIIAEILYEEDAKDSDLTLTEKLAIVKEVSEDAQNAIDSTDIDDFKPVILVANDGRVTSTPNSLPTVTGNASSGAQEIDFGESFSLSVADWFQDKEDNDSDLKYELKIVPESGSNLEIDENSGSITGKKPAAGTYTIYVYAKDTEGVRSYPAVFDLNVIAPNTPPMVDDDEKNSIQAVINDLGLQQGIEANQTVSIVGLFTDDDGDELTITVNENIAGLQIDYDNNQLVFSGTPTVNTVNNPLSFLVSAGDGVHVDTIAAEFNLTILEGIGSHPLEDTVWYQIERGSDDGDGDNTNDYTRVWCDTLQFAGGMAYLNTRTAANRTTCTDTPIAAGNYSVESDKIKITWSDNSTAELSLLDDSFASTDSSDNGTLVQYVETGKGTEALTWFKSKANAEARIQLTSAMPEENGDFQYYRKNGNSYELGEVSVTLGLPEGDNGHLDIDLYFDNLPSGADCKTRVENLFSNFEIAKSDSDDSLSVTKQFSEDAGSCIVDFDISGSTQEDQILGVIAYANDALEAEMSSLYFNIQQNYLPEVTESGLNSFLLGSSDTDYRFIASLNEVEFGDEGVLEASLFGSQACQKADNGSNVCFPFSVDGDRLTTTDDEGEETDQFLYVSQENAFAVPIDSGDLIAWSKAPFTNAGWTAAQLTGKTWYYVDDDSTTDDADPMIVEFAFGNTTVVMDGDTDNAMDWSISGGVLTIDFPVDDSDLILDRLAATGDVVIATNTAVSNKPVIMTEDENLATGIYLQWQERIRVKPQQQPQQ
ncbi:putative Ig domain-containing protein [Endozoicomonas sp. GU-1]|uniref:putative Ig domain-containing protein n=1 Tax=Endozoicomonas sp. GU-1 TaxID=3009078 RepID=UPI0022B3E21B|nr:putative Ig domain-containing protein [Endozoicomonas sp. GU-1]WBA81827.1 putative Ig domain-containing protein [Endozoicomonas sp. GU-1]